MAEPQDKKYDVFISYSSSDHLWAQKLYESLRDRGVKPFWDKESLRTGEQWDLQLEDALNASQHLVVLWSANASNSNWVNQEINFFYRLNANDRRILPIVLEGSPARFGTVQALTLLKEHNAYTNNPEARVDPGLWRQLVDELSVRVRQNTIPIPVVVLTANRKQINELDPDAQVAGVKPLRQLLMEVGIAGPDELSIRYGTKRDDWKPFGSNLKISAILDQLEDEINNLVKEYYDVQFHLEHIKEPFWTGDGQTRQNAADNFCKISPVVIVDPVALYVQEIYRQWLRLQRDCLGNEQTIVMVLTPFDLPVAFRNLREYIEAQAQEIFFPYSVPLPPKDRDFRAMCHLNIADKFDVKRLLLTTVKHRLPLAPRRRNVWLGPGGGK